MHKKNICIFILSNHRSGTSATGGCLNICGIDYGKSKHPFESKGTQWNEKGYFENTAFSEKNNEILESIDQSWNNPYPITEQQENKLKTNEGYASQIIELINEEFDSNVFYIKDPRILFLYPVYVNVLKKANITPYFLWIQRDVEAILKSLWRRGHTNWQDDRELGLMHHQKHVSGFNKFLEGCTSERIPFKFTTLDYQSLVTNPVLELNKIDEIFNLNLVSGNEEEIISFIDGKLKHF